MALKPLFFHSGANFVAFASMPTASTPFRQIPKALDFTEATAIAAGFPILGSSTIFEGIRMVRHGHAVQFADGKETIVPLWDLDSIDHQPIGTKDRGKSLRAGLGRAVRAQLRRRHGPAACHLSSGRDSSAVATTTALVLRESGENLIALTGAPNERFAGPTITGRLAMRVRLPRSRQATIPTCLILYAGQNRDRSESSFASCPIFTSGRSRTLGHCTGLRKCTKPQARTAPQFCSLDITVIFRSARAASRI